MRVPLSWLKDYVDIDITVDELAKKLTDVGVPVESITYMSPDVSGVIAGKIVSLIPHPNADKLVVTQVDIGSETLQIVTGAKNVREGHTIPLAVNKAKLAGDLKIKKSKIRGEESNGMMCSAKELGLDLKDLPIEEREGVMVLPEGTPIGADLIELYCLNDPILEFETFANRPDQLSILGIARETAAALGKEMRNPVTLFNETGENVADHFQVEIEDFKLCPKYSARLIKNVKIRKSSVKVQGRLLAAGIRPINNIVDITNYVMLETGQPLHAFDLDGLRGNKIVVRPAKDGEVMKTLDGEERKLDPDMLMICDGEGPVALAGVMGGFDTEVSNETRNILLESANFNQASIRRTSIRLKLPSESSRRFEKGIDFHRTDLASRRACSLMEREGGEVQKGEAVMETTPPSPARILLRPDRVNRILGTSIHKEDMRKMLAGLDFMMETHGDHFMVEVPTVRKDITMEIDLVEEVARLFGYDNIPTTDSIGTADGIVQPSILFDEKVRDILALSGMWEVVTLGLCEEKVLSDLRIDDKNFLRVVNPVTADQKLVRPSALPRILDCVKKNIANKQQEMKFFELSELYMDTDKEEPESFHELLMLSSAPGANQEFDFFAIKGVIEFLAKELNIPITFRRNSLPWLHPGKTAEIVSGEDVLGYIGVLHPEIALEQGLEQEIVVAKISMDMLFSLQKWSWFEKLPRFPAIDRDIAVVVDESVPAGEVEKIIIEEGAPLVKNARCFDVFRGKQISDEKKSLAFRITFSSPDKTLTDEEVQGKIDAMLKKLGEELNATLRA